MFEIINTTSYDIEDLQILDNLIKKVVKKENLEEALFNIIIVDNDEIKKINKKYRNIDKPTDVISFALEDNELIKLEFRVLGDIYISIEKCIEQANLYNHSVKRELCFLAVHGLLHLLGYDHMTEEDEKEMFKKQEVILNEAGISQ